MQTYQKSTEVFSGVQQPFHVPHAWKYIKHSCFLLYLCLTDSTACFMQGSAPPLCRLKFVYSHNAAEKAAVMAVRNNRRNQAMAIFLPLNIWKGLARSEGELKTKNFMGSPTWKQAGIAPAVVVTGRSSGERQHGERWGRQPCRVPSAWLPCKLPLLDCLRSWEILYVTFGAFVLKWILCCFRYWSAYKILWANTRGKILFGRQMEYCRK